MRVVVASEPARAGEVNEDFFAAVPAGAVLLDGAGTRGAEAICRHGVAWYTYRLGGEIVARLGLDDVALTTLLAEAIAAVADAHRATCDLTDPSSPSSTVAIYRTGGDYLVLGDSVLVLDLPPGPVVVHDRREVDFRVPYQAAYEAAPHGTAEWEEARRVYIAALRANRNQPGGFWLAKDDPRAAAEAIIGTAPVEDLNGVALLSNGASRYVDRFATADWPETLATLSTHGPRDIIRRVRASEQAAGVEPDDATAAYLTDESWPPRPNPA
ncbi:hypothetical protein [Asanoa siamensis]|uniref:Protein phosphatase 2C-like protein n=1 Tax=Asanoa siamensis TaxID=926357 RepID=A0ABQ4D340_9ACTN|nr:hypothetical protein [Asanoa siamensis]GIF77953.1 hypothetical protein Asi02nite_74710 [Asanoa siamensis]